MKLASRMRAGLLLLTGLSLLGPGAFLAWTLHRRQADLEVRALAELEASLERRWADQKWQLRLKLTRMAADLDGQMLGRKRSDEAADALEGLPSPPPLPEQSGLDFLWLLDRKGRILACLHWPARTGGQAAELLALSGGRPQVVSMQVRNERWTGLLLSEPLADAGRGLYLVGGLRLDRLVRDSLVADDAFSLALLDPAGRILAARPWPFPVQDFSTPMKVALDTGARLKRRLPGRAGEMYLTALLPLAGAGHVAGSLLAARSLGPLRIRQQQLLATLAVTAGVVLLLAWILGSVLARRLAAPLGRLTTAAVRIAAGEQSRVAEEGNTGEVRRLSAAFNTMLASLRQGQRDLARSERLGAWRDAARQMAHEVKNPLAPIRLSVENLLRARQLSAGDFEKLFQVECRTVLEEVEALRRLVEEFSCFARSPEPHIRPADVAALVDHVVHLFDRSVTGVQLQQQVARGLPPVPMDPDLMGQVLKNLVANALEAVPRPGGLVQVACRLQGEALMLSVQDNGGGIPAHLRSRLFEPQVTSKTGGSGLGLAISRQIVEAHGGRMDVESRQGRTLFRVFLQLNRQVGETDHGQDSHRR